MDTETPVYLKSADHGWIPALQLKQVSGGKMARVAMPKFKQENDILTCGKMSKAQLMDTIDIPFKDYDNNVLPVQNVDASGNLEDYKDMVELPFMHEVSQDCSVSFTSPHFFLHACFLACLLPSFTIRLQFSTISSCDTRIRNPTHAQPISSSRSTRTTG